MKEISTKSRKSAILTAELVYLGYNVETVFLEAVDFEGKTIIGEIKRDLKDNQNGIKKLESHIIPLGKCIKQGKYHTKLNNFIAAIKA